VIYHGQLTVQGVLTFHPAKQNFSFKTNVSLLNWVLLIFYPKFSHPQTKSKLIAEEHCQQLTNAILIPMLSDASNRKSINSNNASIFHLIKSF
jgi:hypothetical protein